MNKWIRNTLIVLAVLFALIYFVGLPMATDKFASDVLNYDRIEFEEVFEDSVMVYEHFYIDDHKSPEDYGFEKVDIVEFPSVYDEDVMLEGWFVHSAPSDTAPCVLISHGRTSNRLKTMKFLELFQSMGMDSMYNFFIPDYRNSGHASEAPTQFGNKFAEDLNAAILTVNEKYGAKDFTLYSFSMGAMATADMLWRDDLTEKLSSKNITIDRLILDSPLSDAAGTLRMAAENMGVPDFLTEEALSKVSDKVTLPDGEEVLDKMQFSVLLKDVNIPILTLQNEADMTTPTVLLKKELEELGKSNIESVYFDNNPEEEYTHVRMFVQHREKYESAVKSFLAKN